MTTELNATMPDPDSNIQLGEGAVPPSELLGGDISTVFAYRPEKSSIEMALAAVRADQEAMCGYALEVKKMRETPGADADGRLDEVYVTFSPAAHTES